MKDVDIAEAMKSAAAALTPGTTMPVTTMQRAHRARRWVVAVSLVTVAAIATGSVAALRLTSPPEKKTTTTPACTANFQPVGTIGRSTKRITLSAATREAAFFTGFSPEYDTATVNARPRAGRIDASGRVTWFEFNHPEAGFQTRNATSPAAVSSDEAWFIVDAGGRYVGESALWFVDGTRVTRPPIDGPIRSVGMGVVAARKGHVWAGGGSAGGGYVAHLKDGRWLRVPTDTANLGSFKELTIDRGGLPWAFILVEDTTRMPTATGNEFRPGILYLTDALRHFDGKRWHEIGLPDGRISTIEGASESSIWAVRYTPGLEIIRFERGRWHTVASAGDGKAAASVHLSSDDEGRLFIAEYLAPEPGSGNRGQSRLWALTGSALERVALPVAAASTSISSLSATDDGAIWFVAGNTVYRGMCVS